MTAAIHVGRVSGYASGAYSKYDLVIPSATANKFTRAGAADTKVIGYILNDTYADGDPCTVQLFAAQTHIGRASEAVLRAAFVEILANGTVGSGAGPTDFVALTAAADADEYIEYVEAKDMIV